MVRGLSFWTTSLCLLVAVVASILAIWNFTGKDTLWRTVATCVVVGAGTMAFARINAVFGEADEDEGDAAPRVRQGSGIDGHRDGPGSSS